MAEQNPDALRSIIIVGGGTAGWSAAASLSKFLENQSVNITLIESSAIGTVGVGEASVPNIQSFNRFVGLREDDFLKHTNGTFKLGIRFDDWSDLGSSFFHPFGPYGVPLGGHHFHQCFNRVRSLGHQLELSDYSLPVELAQAGKFAMPSNSPANQLSNFGYAYHFDAKEYAGLLKQIALANGVTTLDDRIEQVRLDSETGFISSLEMQASEPQSADLYIDCSGFRSLLLGDALGVDYVSWKKWLPCDRAVALGGEVAPDGPPAYTVSAAREAGWTWNIPLSNRTGNGYVYSSAHISDENALDLLEKQIDRLPDVSPNFQRFEAGRRDVFFHKNCVALGLAGGFIEPLESTSINLVHTGLHVLMDHFPDRNFDPRLAQAANRWHAIEQQNVRDFIILHYKLTGRRDTSFWRDVAEMDIPQTLAEKIAAWKAIGSVIQYEAESFKPDSWITMYEGFGITPDRHHPGANALGEDMILQSLAKIRGSISSVAERAPTHGAFLKQVY